MPVVARDIRRLLWLGTVAVLLRLYIKHSFRRQQRLRFSEASSQTTSEISCNNESEPPPADVPNAVECPKVPDFSTTRDASTSIRRFCLPGFLDGASTGPNANRKPLVLNRCRDPRLHHCGVRCRCMHSFGHMKDSYARWDRFRARVTSERRLMLPPSIVEVRYKS